MAQVDGERLQLAQAADSPPQGRHVGEVIAPLEVDGEALQALQAPQAVSEAQLVRAADMSGPARVHVQALQPAQGADQVGADSGQAVAHAQAELNHAGDEHVELVEGVLGASGGDPPQNHLPVAHAGGLALRHGRRHGLPAPQQRHRPLGQAGRELEADRLSPHGLADLRDDPDAAQGGELGVQGDDQAAFHQLQHIGEFVDLALGVTRLPLGRTACAMVELPLAQAGLREAITAPARVLASATVRASAALQQELGPARGAARPAVAANAPVLVHSEATQPIRPLEDVWLSLLQILQQPSR
mmetsp:Transcript_52058/g.158033  ORF Transcript_52058/g.158033 Transcript_52058/m.158033 type:complete len:301 (-) Transcript_52058:704-1606(-)